MEVALRLLGGQELPRVVSTPQALITKDNVETYRGRRATSCARSCWPQPAALTTGRAAAGLSAGLFARLTPGGRMDQ